MNRDGKIPLVAWSEYLPMRIRPRDVEWLVERRAGRVSTTARSDMVKRK